MMKFCSSLLQFFLGFLPGALFFLFQSFGQTAPPEDKPQMARDELGAKMDELVERALLRHGIPGAVLAVVVGTNEVVLKGYGLADIQSRKAVDPNETLFRIASLSKVVTAAAVLKMIDEGKLGIRDDAAMLSGAAELLSSETEGPPMTWHSLLTHTAGIREAFVPGTTVTKQREKQIPLAEYLERCRPLRWQKPGETLLYSDTGISLAGHLLEIVTNHPFPEVVARLVTEPLRMSSTVFGPPSDRIGLVATAYLGDANQRIEDFEFCNIDPAMGALTTGADMSRFMSGLLGPTFLKPASQELILKPQYSDDARLRSGSTCGLFWAEENGERYLFSMGYALGFQSMIYLLPERQIGIFFSQNKAGNLLFTLKDFLEVYLPEASAKSPNNAVIFNPKQFSDVEGRYALNRTLSSGDGPRDFAMVRRVEPGVIELTEFRNTTNLTRWREIAQLLFKLEGGEDLLSFRETPEGRITYMFGLFPPFGVFKRIPGPVDCPAPDKESESNDHSNERETVLTKACKT